MIQNIHFYPNDNQVPSLLKTNEFIFLPLNAGHAVLDHDALMVSKNSLREWSQSEWPEDDFPLETNRDELALHDKEHIERKAFTFTVLSPKKDKCLGAIYIVPLGETAKDEFKMLRLAENKQIEIYAADISFWVREPCLKEGLEERVLKSLAEWLKNEWEFSFIIFRTGLENLRQRKLFENSGFKLWHEWKFAMWDDFVPWAGYQMDS